MNALFLGALILECVFLLRARTSTAEPTSASPLEVSAKLLVDWRDAESEGRVFALSFSEDLVPSEVGLALISQEVLCGADSASHLKQLTNQPFVGPLLVRVVPDPVRLDSTETKNAFKPFMANADSMKSWANPCSQGSIFLNFTSALREGLQANRRTLYLVLYAPTRKVMTFSRTQPKFRLTYERDIHSTSASKSRVAEPSMAILLRAEESECPKGIPGLDGVVNVEITIESNGKVSGALAAQTDLPTAYQDSAVETALRTVWEPARNTGGSAVRSRVTLPISFSCSTQPK